MSHQTFLASLLIKNMKLLKPPPLITSRSKHLSRYSNQYTYIHAVGEENGIWERRAHSFVTARTLSTNRCNI